jgi:hypothetical protein
MGKPGRLVPRKIGRLATPRSWVHVVDWPGCLGRLKPMLLLDLGVDQPATPSHHRELDVEAPWFQVAMVRDPPRAPCPHGDAAAREPSFRAPRPALCALVRWSRGCLGKMGPRRLGLLEPSLRGSLDAMTAKQP